MTTTAEQVSALFGNDGQRWTTADGESLKAVCMRMGARVSRREDDRRYTFADRSAIVVAGDAWDLAVEVSDEDDFCWAGVGHTHTERCSA